VETGKAVPLSDVGRVPDVPKSPEVYASNHPDRINKFKSANWRMLEKPERNASPWRHELDHDAESVFWLLVYWAMVVQPADLVDSSELIDTFFWASLLGGATNRNMLVGCLAHYTVPSGLTHSSYTPLCH
jgi:hypothetical protein